MRTRMGTMKRFRNILLIAGGNGWEEVALKRAVALAKSSNAKLSVVEVIERWPHKMRMAAASVDLAELQEIAIEEKNRRLEQCVAGYRNKGLRITTGVVCGTPFLEIIREVLRKKHDLVIKTARGNGRFRNSLFGSTALHLMRKCPCPVWVIKPSQRRKFARIMAAVDVDAHCRESISLNRKIMKLSTLLTRMENSDFHIVHAWALYGETILSAHGEINKGSLDRIKGETRKQHKTWLDAFVKKYSPETPEDRIHLLKGRAEKVIPEVAKRKGIELIVMGTVCRRGIAGFFMGNTAEKVLQQVDCSVLTVKPDGFVSPVKLRQ
jgi:universal stress protein E